MGTFDFLSGMSAPNANAQAGASMQQYQQFQPTTDYSQILGGGQAQSPATQGLDFSKIGQWALQQNQYPGQPQQGQDWQKILQDSYGATKPTLPTGQFQHQQQAGRSGGPLGQVNQQRAGYIGGNTMSGLLGSVR